jgi:hypothetical protein
LLGGIPAPLLSTKGRPKTTRCRMIFRAVPTRSSCDRRDRVRGRPRFMRRGGGTGLPARLAILDIDCRSKDSPSHRRAASANHCGRFRVIWRDRFSCISNGQTVSDCNSKRFFDGFPSCKWTRCSPYVLAGIPAASSDARWVGLPTGPQAMPAGEAPRRCRGPANCTKWLTVRTGSERLQIRDAVCVDKIRA